MQWVISSHFHSSHLALRAGNHLSPDVEERKPITVIRKMHGVLAVAE